MHAAPSEFVSSPHVELSNGDTRLVVLLPDPVRGYYRGPRFAWVGTVAWAASRGHTFFGSWRSPPHRPRANDDTAGTADELGTGPLTGNPPPLGYDDAAVGEEFLKIGVGRLQKIRETAYSFGALYRIARPGAWSIRQQGLSIRFSMDDGPVRGHAYRSTKTISLSAHEPSFLVSHAIGNTGAHPIVQTDYCHNFLRIDERGVGPGCTIELPFEARLVGTSGDMLRAASATISFSRDPRPGEGFFALVEGYGEAPEHNRMLVRAGGAGLRITGSEPLCRLQVFGTNRTFCPEAFVFLSIAPGDTRTWTIRYELIADWGL